MIEVLSNSGFQMLPIRITWGACKNPDALATLQCQLSHNLWGGARPSGFFLKLPMCSQI